MEIGTISALRPAGTTPRLQVRVIRKWSPVYRVNETHYLFVEKEGIGIQARIKGRNRRSVEQRLLVNSCYEIASYACITPDEFTNTLTHPALIIFGTATKITPIADVKDIDTQYFEIASRRGAEMQVATEGIIDYIGILRDIKDRTTVKNQPYVILSLRDTSNQDITIAVWEEVCKNIERFDRRTIEKAAPPVILALTGLKAKRLTSTLQLQSTNATYVYLNPEIVQTYTLKTMFDTMDLTPNATIPRIENHVSVTELIHMSDKDTTGKTYTVNGYVLSISIHKGWHYTGCPKCGKLIYPTGPDWYCPDDGDHDNARFAYRIPLTICHNTGVMNGIMFDEPATQLLQISCHDMTSNDNNTNLLQQMIGKNAVFNLQVQKEPKNGTTTCTINKAHCITDVQDSEQQATPEPQTPAKTAEIPGVTENTTKRTLFAEQDTQLSTSDNTGKITHLPLQTNTIRKPVITDTTHLTAADKPDKNAHQTATKRPLAVDEATDENRPLKKPQEDREADQP